MIEERRRKLPALAGVERERRDGRLDLPECVPEERRAAWELALCWLPMMLVTIEGPIDAGAVLQLAPLRPKALPGRH